MRTTVCKQNVHWQVLLSAGHGDCNNLSDTRLHGEYRAHATLHCHHGSLCSIANLCYRPCGPCTLQDLLLQLADQTMCISTRQEISPQS